MAKKAYIGVAKYINSLGDVAVGSTVKLNVNGTATNFLVVHQGNPDSSLYDASCDGTWVLAEKVYVEKMNYDESSTIYATSDIHEYLNTTYLDAIDSNVKSSIKQVKIPYLSDASTLSSGSDGASSKVFLLSGVEVGLESIYTNSPLDGAKLDYFPSNSGQLAIRVAYYGTQSCSWWLRTGNGTVANRITGTGTYDSGWYSDHSSVRPAFILPSSLAVTDGFIDGTEAESVGVARKVKKGYIGIEDVARKIKKAYIGIGGVARPCWSGGELAYYGTITPLQGERSDIASTSLADYALICGGQNSGGPTTQGDAYNKSLVRSNCYLSTYRAGHSAASVGGYALFFGGGYNGDTTVDAFNSSLGRESVSGNIQANTKHAATSVGNYAIVAGGNNSAGVTAFDSSLTLSTPTSLSQGRQQLAATAIGNYALFGGGANTSSRKNYNTVDRYDTSLTKGTASSLLAATYELAATTVGNYALFGGGYGSEKVTAYDQSLSKTTATALSRTAQGIFATTVGDYALFVGDSLKSGIVEVYDKSLTKTIFTPLATGRSRLTAVTVGDYALIAGGASSSSNYTSVVEAYTVA